MSIVFEESEISYWFMANSAKDQDEWSTAISSGRYVYNMVQTMKTYPYNVYHILRVYPSPPFVCASLYYVCMYVYSYEYLRMAFSELRGQLMHLTGTDPLVENHPLGGIPIKVNIHCYYLRPKPLLCLIIFPHSFMFQNVSPVPGKLKMSLCLCLN